MTDRDDELLVSLYRQSSQEQPPARLDHAVIAQASKAARPRPSSPFGSYWVAAGTFASIGIASVVLVSLMQDRPELTVLPDEIDEKAVLEQHADLLQKQSADTMDGLDRRVVRPEVSGESFSRKRSSVQRSRAAGGEAGKEEQDRSRPPAVANPGFRYHAEPALPAAEGIVSEQIPEPVVTPLASPLPAKPGAYYLVAGSFKDLTVAENLRQRLKDLDLPVEIQEIRSKTGLHWQVRVGLLQDLAAVKEVRNTLGKHGIVSRLVNARE